MVIFQNVNQMFFLILSCACTCTNFWSRGRRGEGEGEKGGRDAFVKKAKHPNLTQIIKDIFNIPLPPPRDIKIRVHSKG